MNKSIDAVMQRFVSYIAFQGDLINGFIKYPYSLYRMASRIIKDKLFDFERIIPEKNFSTGIIVDHGGNLFR